MPRPAPRIKIGSSPRFKLIFQERQWRQNPGPGSYKESGPGVYYKGGNESKKSGRSTFSRSLRQGVEYFSGKDKDLIAESPGPGNYNLPKLIGGVPSYEKLPKMGVNNNTKS